MGRGCASKLGVTKRDPMEKVALQGSSMDASTEKPFQSSHPTSGTPARAQLRSTENGIAMECDSVIQAASGSTKNVNMNNICREGSTKNGRRARSSGPERIGMPRLNRIRDDPPSSPSSSGNASVKNGVIGYSSEERLKKESEGLVFSMARPATIVSSSRNVKVRLPHWESICGGGK